MRLKIYCVLNIYIGTELEIGNKYLWIRTDMFDLKRKNSILILRFQGQRNEYNREWKRECVKNWLVALREIFKQTKATGDHENPRKTHSFQKVDWKNGKIY